MTRNPPGEHPAKKTQPRRGDGASKAESAVRRSPEGAVSPSEKRAIGAETSREEDA